MISEALIRLGYQGFSVIGEDIDQINWIIEPDKKPTKKQILDMVEQLPALKEAEEQAKEAAKESALAKLAALGLTEDEAKAIMGVN